MIAKNILPTLSWLLLLSLSCLIVNCGTSKKVAPTTEPKRDIEIDALVEQVVRAYPNHKNLLVRGNLSFDNGKRSDKVSLQLRFQNKKAIWTNVVMIVPLARMLITPEKVKFYERFQKTFLVEDFESLQEFLPTGSIGFTQLENLLLGKALVDISKYKWQQIENPKNYIIVPEKTKGDIVPTLFIDPQTFLIYEQRVLIPSSSNSVSIRYKNHINIEGDFFPKIIEVNIIGQETNLQLVLEYAQIGRHEVDLDIPFDIPTNYTRITIP